MPHAVQPPLLTIAGYDPSSGAGITADLAVFAAHRRFGISCITALTDQDTRGVHGVYPQPAAMLQSTLHHLQQDLPPAGIKIGMLATAAIVRAVSDFLATLQPRPVVVLDPVLRSSSGHLLLEQEGIDLLKKDLLPLVDWVTPNLAEAALLAEESGASAAVLASQIGERWPNLHVVVTDGDMAAPTDTLRLPGGEHFVYTATRIDTKSTHGTGCAFSSALLCGLALGMEPSEAVQSAKHYVTEALRFAEPRGSGRGPMNLLWSLKTGR